MLQGRLLSTATGAWLLAAGGFMAAACTAPAARAQAAPTQAAAAKCEDALQIAILPAPFEPWKGAPLRVLLASEKPLDGELSLIAPDGTVAAKSRANRGRAALLLVCRSCLACRRDLARDAGARP